RHHRYLPSFPTRRSSDLLNPVGPRISLGAIAGWGLTRDQADAHYPAQTILPIPQPGGGYTYAQVSGTGYVAGLRTMIAGPSVERSEEHTSELQSQSNLVC